MEVRIDLISFLQILTDLEFNFLLKIKSNLELLDLTEENLDLNILYNENLNFNIFNLLKHENKTVIDEKTELIYLSRQNVSKLDVINRRKKLYGILKEFKECVLYVKDSDITNNNFYIYKNKLEFEKFIKNILVKNCKLFLMKEKEFLIFLKEFLIVLRIKFDKNNNLNINSFVSELEERINLNFYQIRKRNYYEEDFELHKAVYENNLRLIRKICAMESTQHFICEINEIDSNGNTPLMLAIKLNNFDVINVLCDHDADIKHKSFEGDISPIEYGINLKNKKILKILINGMKKQKINNWENNKNEVLKIIKSIPDFSMDLRLNFDSNIFSLFSSLTPNDYYKISKSGGNVRIDMNISAINSSFRSIKGKSSILLQENGNKLSIFKIDHEKKTVNN